MYAIALNCLLLAATTFSLYRLTPFILELLNNSYNNEKKLLKNINLKKKIGLLTNEIPPVIYGGVSTWIVNFMDMFKDDETYEVIPIFLAYYDKDITEILKRYPTIRIVYNPNDIIHVFSDIDICVNNLWIALDTIKQIVTLYPQIPMISVCHSLIKMEHITNLGSCYTNNFFDQEITFQYSDFVILISQAEKKYYEEFGYTRYKAIPVVIYNSFTPKFDIKDVFDNYNCDNVGYIGRHVPRKRPELAILGVNKIERSDVKVYNMGVDYDRYENEYWDKLQKQYENQLNIIPFTSDKKVKEDYYKQIGVNCCTGTYEPFGYTLCEVLDRRIPVIVQNIDGPSEIVEKVKNHVYMYDVDSNLDNDVNNFTKALTEFYDTSPEQRKENSEKARKALDNFRPAKIKDDWVEVLNNVKVRNKTEETIEEDKPNVISSMISYGYKLIKKIKIE